MWYGRMVEKYLAGPEILSRSVSGMTDDQLNESPIPFNWSTRQVVLHLVDMDLIYADHMKRVLAEDDPTLQGMRGGKYGTQLAYERRDVDEEVCLVMAVRRHLGRILRACNADDFKRRGYHTMDGSLTLANLLQRAVDHIPKLTKCIEENRKALHIRARASNEKVVAVEPATACYSALLDSAVKASIQGARPASRSVHTAGGSISAAG
jgi:hypothetical protein